MLSHFDSTLTSLEFNSSTITESTADPTSLTTNQAYVFQVSFCSISLFAFTFTHNDDRVSVGSEQRRKHRKATSTNKTTTLSRISWWLATKNKKTDDFKMQISKFKGKRAETMPNTLDGYRCTHY